MGMSRHEIVRAVFIPGDLPPPPKPANQISSPWGHQLCNPGSKETGHIPQEGATSGHRRLTKIRSLKVKVVIGPLLPTPVTEAVPDDLAGGEIHVL